MLHDGHLRIIPEECFETMHQQPKAKMWQKITTMEVKKESWSWQNIVDPQEYID